MDHCTIRDIYTNEEYHGTAVFLYQAPDTGNHIDHCVIERVDGESAKAGDAVFLQPHIDNAGGDPVYSDTSRLTITCTTISRDWFSELTNVHSQCRVLRTAMLQGNIGVSALIDANTTLEYACLSYNRWQGVLSSASEFFLLSDSANWTRVVENDSAQIELLDGSQLSGWRMNHIDHQDQNVPRVRMRGNSDASMIDNWWGDPEPPPSYFDIEPGSGCIWDPPLRHHQ